MVEEFLCEKQHIQKFASAVVWTRAKACFVVVKMCTKFKDNIAQYLCVALLLCATASASAQYEHYADALGANIFYEHQEGSASPVHYLNDGDSEFVALDLDEPINFYSEKYDKLFVSILGPYILAFKHFPIRILFLILGIRVLIHWIVYTTGLWTESNFALLFNSFLKSKDEN